MNVASKAFFIFLPTVLLVYHLLGRRSHKYGFLLFASWVFYAWASPKYLMVLLALTVIDYCAGLAIEAAADDRKRKRWLVLSIASNLGLLVLFKVLTSFEYSADLAANPLARFWLSFSPSGHDAAWRILLPLGISFHTFQGISYTVDVYRRQIRAVPGFFEYALFVAFFPQLAAGPIVRAVEFLPQMATPPRVSSAQVSDGLSLLLMGLFKKLFIADQLHELFVKHVFADPTAYDPATIRWAALAWTVQIYVDFSGYTDIAIGTGKLFGFELPANFRLPYLATSIADFWRRWHLSLSTWLRDYLYYPLGGSRCGPARVYFNLLFVFLLCGLWHGAEWKWLLFGLYNGLLMAGYRVYDRAVGGIRWCDALRATTGWLAFSWAITMGVLVLGLTLIRIESWSSASAIFGALFRFGEASTAAAPTAFVPWVAGAPLAVPVLMAMGLAGHVGQLLGAVRIRWPEPARAFAAACAVALLVTLGPGAVKSFIYIQF